MILKLKASHFEKCEDGFDKQSKYLDNYDCPVGKAAKEHFNTPDVCEMVEYINVDGLRYSHGRYTFKDFCNDYDKALEAEFSPDVVIRELTLTQQG